MTRRSEQVRDGIDTLRKSERRLLLFLRSSRGVWIGQMEMLRVAGLRFGARIHDLRRKGIKVETKRLGPTKFVYRLPRRRWNDRPEVK